MAEEHNDIDDWFQEPNADAYIKTEERTGPPLDYIAEKMRRCTTFRTRAGKPCHSRFVCNFVSLASHILLSY